VEIATHALHRLTCYEPGREWTDPIDDPRVRNDFEPNDLDRLPWFAKRYAPGLPAVPLPRGLPAMPTPAEVDAIGERWRPYRSLACMYLWRSLHATPV